MRTLFILACAAGFLALGASDHIPDNIAWGPPDHGLRFGIAFGPTSPEPQIRLVFQNIDRPECLVPLGSTSAKGPVYDVEFTLKAPDGKESPVFNFNGPQAFSEKRSLSSSRFRKGKNTKSFSP